MSVSIGVAATMLFLAISPDNETWREMQKDSWHILGLCNSRSGRAYESCEWGDDTRHCQLQREKQRPCDRGRWMWKRFQDLPLPENPDRLVTPVIPVA